MIDHCDRCRGVWFDRGELFHVAKDPKRLAERLEAAQQSPTPSDKASPATGEPLVEMAYPSGITIHSCPGSGGLWLEAEQLSELLAHDQTIRFTVDGTATGPITEERPQDRAILTRSAREQPSAAPVLRPLPNLYLRSSVTLAALYALLGVALIAAVEFAGLNLEMAVGIGIIVVVLQFLAGPFLLDMTLRWLYRMRWVGPKELPEHLRLFVERACEATGIGFPRFGIIDDGAPQAFTYGHTPRNARIVISRGILELLAPEEAEAVVAHELGHAVHWDMLLMTIAQLVPMVLYYLYRMTIRAARSSRRGKSSSGAILIAVGTYILYLVSQYLVLWFSRSREYHADRFAGALTGNPSLLASALVKIAYGLAARDEKEGTEDEPAASPIRGATLGTVGLLGIFDAGTAQALAISSYAGAERAVDERNLKGAMKWDIWNPWAKWYELNSTHPLVANRLRYLSEQAAQMGQAPYVVFDERRPESYWDEFIVDLIIHLLPLAAIILVLLSFGVVAVDIAPRGGDLARPVTVGLLGLALLVRFRFAYRGDFFPEMSVAALLKKVKVSSVRPVPCTVRGTVIGRGVPGYITSEDFVLRDDTGIIFLDYRQPLAIWELLFGLLKAEEYQGRKIAAEGWYRRAPVPYVQLKSMSCDGKTRKCWVPIMNQFTALVLIAVGIVWALAQTKILAGIY